MKILAIDTATEQCSAAIATDRTTWSRVVPTARSHADLILPMVDELLRESGLTLGDVDGLAFGRGPGSFTGVRIAVSVIQGLALASGKRVVGISNLAAVAQQAVSALHLPSGGKLLVCMDARMHEVYWARYRIDDAKRAVLDGDERVGSPDAVRAGIAADENFDVGIGTGWRAYAELRDRFPGVAVHGDFLPRAQEVAHLAFAEFAAGRSVAAAQAQPVYLRDQVAAVPR